MTAPAPHYYGQQPTPRAPQSYGGVVYASIALALTFVIAIVALAAVIAPAGYSAFVAAFGAPWHVIGSVFGVAAMWALPLVLLPSLITAALIVIAFVRRRTVARKVGRSASPVTLVIAILAISGLTPSLLLGLAAIPVSLIPQCYSTEACD